MEVYLWLYQWDSPQLHPQVSSDGSLPNHNCRGSQEAAPIDISPTSPSSKNRPQVRTEVRNYSDFTLHIHTYTYYIYIHVYIYMYVCVYVQHVVKCRYWKMYEYVCANVYVYVYAHMNLDM